MPDPIPGLMPNNNYFDLPGIIDVQQNYLTDISLNAYGKNPTDIAINVNNLQKNLLSVSNSYTNADQSSDALLTDQKDVINIVKTEKQRLDDKQQLIYQMEQENKRKVLLNETYRKQKVQYSKMMVVVIVALIFYIVITFIGKYTTMNGGFLVLLYILDISIAIIIIVNMGLDMLVRDNINYDEIYIPPPSVDACGNLISTDSSSNSIWSYFKFGCYESTCCANGTVYDMKLKMCVVPTIATSPGPNNPGPNNPGSNNPGPNNPGSNNPGSNNPGPNNPGSNNPGSNNPGSNNPGSNNPGSNNPGIARQPFSTIDQAIEYGDFDKNYKILPKESYMIKTLKPSKGNEKPYTDLDFTEYKFIQTKI